MPFVCHTRQQHFINKPKLTYMYMMTINVTLPVKAKLNPVYKTEHQGYQGVQDAYRLAGCWVGEESCCSYGKKQKN